MENSSKALLIAAAVLIGVLLITVSIKIFSSPQDVQQQATDVGTLISEKMEDATQYLSSSLETNSDYTSQKYFTFTLNKYNKTATVTGIADDWAYKFYWYDSDYYKTAIQVEEGKYITDIVIPSKYVDTNGTEYTVTAIGNSAFNGGGWYYGGAPEISFTSFVIPDTVTSIGNSAFNGCSSLTSITIPSSVTNIESYAFNGSRSLTSITIPTSVTSIGDSAFSNCSSLKSITIPSSVTTISKRLFSNCSSLKSITIPSSVTSIGHSAFNACSSLESITIPRSVTSIEGNAFIACSSLKSIKIPRGVKSIGIWAFAGCSKLESIYCEARIKPSGWNSKWNSGCSAKVYWNS